MFLGSLWHFGSCPDLLTVCGSLGLLCYISTSASFPGFMLLVSDAFLRKDLGKHEGMLGGCNNGGAAGVNGAEAALGDNFPENWADPFERGIQAK